MPRQMSADSDDAIIDHDEFNVLKKHLTPSTAGLTRLMSIRTLPCSTCCATTSH